SFRQRDGKRPSQRVERHRRPDWPLAARRDVSAPDFERALQAVAVLDYFAAVANVFCSHVMIAPGTLGLMRFSVSVRYSSYSPVVAGTRRWLTPGTLTTSTGAAFFLARASVSSRSVFEGGTCVSSRPWTMRIGCRTLGITFAASNARKLRNQGPSACFLSGAGIVSQP